MVNPKLTVFAVVLILFSLACGKRSGSPQASDETAQQTRNSEGSQPQSGSSSDNLQAPEPSPTQPAAVPAPPPKPVVIPAGTVITVRLLSSLGSKSSHIGDTFQATVAEPVTVAGKSVIPKGAPAIGTVVDAKAKGKIKGEARLKLGLNKITIKGKDYAIQTTMAEQTAKGKGKRTAVATGGGAAGGALIGGIAGGGKGAGIGALVGASAGFVGGALTGNKQIELPAETILPFQLTSSITLK